MTPRIQRDKTRRQKYQERLKNAKTLPVSIATINFRHEINLAHVVRAAVCFGAKEVYVVGGHPSRKIMNEVSASLFDYIGIKSFPTPSSLLRYTDRNDIKVVSIELPLNNFQCHSIFNYKPDFSRELCLVVGHETLGVPTEILNRSDIVYIPMAGAGSCLNTSQAANIALYEMTKRYYDRY